MRPCRLEVSRRSDKTLKTIAVLLSETRNPWSSAPSHGTPFHCSKPVTTAIVKAICNAPPKKILRGIDASCAIENSIPIVNRSRTIPISASVATPSTLGTKPKPCGPINTPASKKPTIAGTFSFCDRKTVETVAARIMTSSLRKPSCDMNAAASARGRSCGLLGLVLDRDHGVDAAAHVEIADHRHRFWTARVHQIVQDLVHNFLVKGSFTAKRPEVELERLEFDAQLIRHVANANRREVGLARARADTGKFRAFHADLVVPLGPRVGKGFEIFARNSRHQTILAKAE